MTAEARLRTALDPGAGGPRPTDPIDWSQRTPLIANFAAEPEPVDYIVEGLIERRSIAVLSGDTGSAKSLLVESLLTAVATGGDWLGRRVNAAKGLLIDEENPARVLVDRLRALGMTNERRDGLCVFNQIGASLGDGDWLSWLDSKLAEEEPDLVVIDTALMATGVDVNDNAAVAGLYGQLKPLANRHGLAIVILHHERKQQAGQSRDPGQAMMGARSWAGQADTHLVVTAETQVSEEPGENGRRELRSSFLLRMKKNRDGEPHFTNRVVVTSEKDQGGRLFWLKVTDEGPVEKKQSKAAALKERVATIVGERGDTQRSDLHDAVGGPDAVAPTTLSRALKDAVDEGLVRLVKHGVYGPPETQESLL